MHPEPSTVKLEQGEDESAIEKLNLKGAAHNQSTAVLEGAPI
jgi:hypothetical protein